MEEFERLEREREERRLQQRTVDSGPWNGAPHLWALPMELTLLILFLFLIVFMCCLLVCVVACIVLEVKHLIIRINQIIYLKNKQASDWTNEYSGISIVISQWWFITFNIKNVRKPETLWYIHQVIDNTWFIRFPERFTVWAKRRSINPFLVRELLIQQLLNTHKQKIGLV